MAKPLTHLSPDYIKSRLSHDKDTGVFTWLPRPGVTRYERSWNKRYAGKEAGCKTATGGYLQIFLDGHMYLGHRLAWVIMYGRWPNGEIDHRNARKMSNTEAELREATRTQNQGNKPLQKNNTSGYKGVYLYKGKWRAMITQHGKTVYLGHYPTPQAAHEVYMKAARVYFGVFAKSDFRKEVQPEDQTPEEKKAA